MWLRELGGRGRAGEGELVRVPTSPSREHYDDHTFFGQSAPQTRDQDFNMWSIKGTPDLIYSRNFLKFLKLLYLVYLGRQVTG